MEKWWGFQDDEDLATNPAHFIFVIAASMFPPDHPSFSTYKPRKRLSRIC
jgi:hypothetical protein